MIIFILALVFSLMMLLFYPALKKTKEEYEEVLNIILYQKEKEKIYFIEEKEYERNFKLEFEKEKLNENYRKILLLDDDFSLNEAWIERILAITSTTQGGDSIASFGPCVMHSLQIIAEILENPKKPRTKGGYFFDTRFEGSFTDTFETKHLSLYEKFIDFVCHHSPLYKQNDEFGKITQSFHFFKQKVKLFLPSLKWTSLGSAYMNECESLLTKLTNAYGARIYLAYISYLEQDKTLSNISHVIVLVRTLQGFAVIPTNFKELNDHFSFLFTHLATNAKDLADFILLASKVDEDEVLSVGILEARAL